MTQPKAQWTTGKKVAITIILAVICWALFGCAESPGAQSGGTFPSQTSTDTDQAFLRKMYFNYNMTYFENKLPHDTVIKYDLGDGDQADTSCLGNDGTDCTIRFNPHFVAAQRNAEIVLLHEMCHIKVWSKTLIGDMPPSADRSRYDHGRVWRACMVQLDSQDAFRDIVIDYYGEK